MATDTDSALLDIYRKIRPGDPATLESARNLVQSIFFDARRYDMAKVGRYKMNKKLGSQLPLAARTLTKEDLISILRYIINLNAGEGTTDDIDHLENKRVRSVGELLVVAAAHGLPPHGEGRQRAHDQPGQRQHHPAGDPVGQADHARASRASSAPRSCRSSWTRPTRSRS